MVRYFCMHYRIQANRYFSPLVSEALDYYTSYSTVFLHALIRANTNLVLTCYVIVIISYVLLRKPVLSIRLGIGNTSCLGKHSMVL